MWTRTRARLRRWRYEAATWFMILTPRRLWYDADGRPRWEKT